MAGQQLGHVLECFGKELEFYSLGTENALKLLERKLWNHFNQRRQRVAWRHKISQEATEGERNVDINYDLDCCGGKKADADPR